MDLSRSTRRLDLLFIFSGLSLLLLGSCGALILGLATFSVERPAERPLAYAQLAAILALGALGGPLLLAGSRVRSGDASPASGVRRGRLFALAIIYGLALAGGQFALSRDILPWAVLPLAHAVASIAPLAALVGWATGRIAGFTPRRVFAHVAFGAWGAGFAALMLEGAVVVTALSAAAIGLASRPGGLGQLRDLFDLIRSPGFLDSEADQLQLILKPWVMAGLGLMAVIVAPLAEESFKAVGVPIAALLGRQPGPASGLLGGLLGGAGYALLENIMSVGPDIGFWAGASLVRLGPLVMHTATGALVGWGWAQALSLRRPGRLALSYLGALFIHGSWNFAVVGLVYAGAQITVNAGSPLAIVLGGAAVLVLGAWLVLLFVGCAFGLVWGVSRVR